MMYAGIVSGIVSAVAGALGSLFNLLPSGSLSQWFSAPISSVLSGRAVGLDGIFPLHELADLVATAYSLLVPALIVYHSANWVYRHIPQVLGTGPGAG